MVSKALTPIIPPTARLSVPLCTAATEVTSPGSEVATAVSTPPTSVAVRPVCSAMLTPVRATIQPAAPIRGRTARSAPTAASCSPHETALLRLLLFFFDLRLGGTRSFPHGLSLRFGAYPQAEQVRDEQQRGRRVHAPEGDLRPAKAMSGIASRMIRRVPCARLAGEAAACSRLA